MATDSGAWRFITECLPVSGQVITNSRDLKTEIAQRLSVVLSLAAAYFIFQEQFNQLKMLGIVLGISSVLCILFSHRQASESSRQGMFFWVWCGLVMH